MSKSLIAALFALPGLVIAWWAKGLIEDMQQQIAVTAVSTINPSMGASIQTIFTIIAIAGIITVVFTILAKFGIK
jgi:hypothetical protein